MGIKYLLTAVNYVPFLSNKGPRSNEATVDNDDLELLKNIKITGSNSGAESSKYETKPNVNSFEGLEQDNEDAVEPEETEDSESEEDEESEPEPVKKTTPVKSTRGRGRGKQTA